MKKKGSQTGIISRGDHHITRVNAGLYTKPLGGGYKVVFGKRKKKGKHNKENRGVLLQKHIFCTPSVMQGFELNAYGESLGGGEDPKRESYGVGS